MPTVPVTTLSFDNAAMESAAFHISLLNFNQRERQYADHLIFVNSEGQVSDGSLYPLAAAMFLGLYDIVVEFR